MAEKKAAKPRQKRTKKDSAERATDETIKKFYCPFSGKTYEEWMSDYEYKKFVVMKKGIPVKPSPAEVERLSEAQKELEAGYEL